MQRSRLWIPYVYWSLNFLAVFLQLQKYIASITRMIFFHLILHPTVPDFDIIIFLFIISSELLIKILLAHSELVSAPSQLFLGMSCRRGSGINTDRFPKRGPKAQALSKGVWGAGLPRNVLVFHPFPGFRTTQVAYCPGFNLESVFIIENVFIMKNLTDFHKTVETGVDPRLSCHVMLYPKKQLLTFEPHSFSIIIVFNY